MGKLWCGPAPENTIFIFTNFTDFTNGCVQDYPSVGQLVMQLKKNNIQPIFAVTKKTETVYQVNILFLIIGVPNFIYVYSTLCNLIVK